MARAAAPSPRRSGRAILRGLLDLRPSPGVARTAVSAEDAMARGLAVAKVYAFASVDYPGAAQSLVFDSDGTTAVGAFVFDPGSGTSPTTAFTFAGGVYQILTVPSSNVSIATGINGAGLIVGVHEDLASVRHGFAKSGGTFSNVDFPGATFTQAIGVNDAGQIVGDYFDAASVEHGFVSSAGTFTAINFPGATATAATGINAAGDIVGVLVGCNGLPRLSAPGRRLHPHQLSSRDEHERLRHQRHGGDRRLLQRRRRQHPRLHLRRRLFQHRGRRRCGQHASHPHQERRVDHWCLRRRPE